VNISTRWADATQTILYIHFRGQWTLDELYLTIESANRLTAAVTHPYVVIADLTNSVSIPARILSIGNYVENQPRKADAVYVVGAGHFFNMTLRTFQSQFPAAVDNLVRCETVGAAYAQAGKAIAALQQA